MTLAEILNDRDKYPDTLSYKVGELEMTLGELRNQAMPKADYTKETQRWAQEREQLATQAQQQQQQAQQQLWAMQQQLQTLNQELLRRGQPPAGTVDEAMGRLEQDSADPTLGPYARNLRKLMREVDELRTDREEMKRQLKQHEEAFWLDKHSAVLRGIQERDPEFRNNPQKTQALLQFAQQNQMSNLDLAYKVYTRDRDLEHAKEEARKEAEAKYTMQQQVNAQAPHIPAGSKAPSPASATAIYTPPPDARDPLEAAADAAQGDPTLEEVGKNFAASWDGRG